MTEKQLVSIEQILTDNNRENQVDMCIEECSELIKALVKFRRKDHGDIIKKTIPDLRLDIAEEIADVEIMLEQMKSIYQCHSMVEELIDFKLERYEKQKKSKQEKENK